MVSWDCMLKNLMTRQRVGATTGLESAARHRHELAGWNHFCLTDFSWLPRFLAWFTCFWPIQIRNTSCRDDRWSLISDLLPILETEIFSNAKRHVWTLMSSTCSDPLKFYPLVYWQCATENRHLKNVKSSNYMVNSHVFVRWLPQKDGKNPARIGSFLIRIARIQVWEWTQVHPTDLPHWDNSSLDLWLATGRTWNRIKSS